MSWRVDVMAAGPVAAGAGIGWRELLPVGKEAVANECDQELISQHALLSRPHPSGYIAQAAFKIVNPTIEPTDEEVLGRRLNRRLVQRQRAQWSGKSRAIGRRLVVVKSFVEG